MADVIKISSPSEIPEGEQFVLLMYGPAKTDVRHSRGVTLTIALQGEPDDLKRVEFATALEGAKRLADDEHIAAVYVVEAGKPAGGGAGGPF